MKELAGGFAAEPLTVPTTVRLRYTTYAVTAVSSVAAVQDRTTMVPVAVPVSPVGTVGASVSCSQNGGVTDTVGPACETFPASSRAFTYHPQVAPPTTGRRADVVVPGTDVT